MLYGYSSNRWEVLATIAAQLMKAERAYPYLIPHRVVVESTTLGRWIHMWLAKSYGIQANQQIISPAQLLTDTEWYLPQLSGKQYCDQSILQWRILLTLQSPAAQKIAQEIALPGNHRPLLLHELALQLAELYEEYLSYRPDWILCWESQKKGPYALPNDPNLRWQTKLWNLVITG